MPVSSSTLSALADWCPRALDLAEDGAPRDDLVFAAGTAAHAVLEEVQRRALTTPHALDAAACSAIAAGVVADLSLKGRTYQGRQEPPLPLDRAAAGADLALAYLAAADYRLPPGSRPEHRLAVDAEWQPCDYDAREAHYRGVLDLIWAGPLENGEPAIAARDYKTAWTSGPAWLESVQARGQLLLLAAHRHLAEDEPEHLVSEVVNLRTHAIHSRAVSLTYDRDLLETWRAQIDALVAAVPARPREGRPARVGPNCGACPWRGSCAALTAALGDATDLDLASAWGAYSARASALASRLREATKHVPIDLADGRQVGYRAQVVATVAPDAPTELARLYSLDPDAHPALLTLLSHLATTGGIRNALKVLRGPDAVALREEWAARLLLPGLRARFGVHAEQPTATVEGEPDDLD